MDSPGLKRPASSIGGHSAKKKCTTPSITNYFVPRPRDNQPVTLAETVITPSKQDRSDKLSNILTPPKTQKHLSPTPETEAPQTPRTSSITNRTLKESTPTTPKQGINTTVVSNNDEHNFAHLNYQFLQPENRRDINGKPPNDPDYDDKTLYVPRSFLDSQTPALRQWWLIKQRNMDAILLFKMGKFYELFNEDAVIGVNELDIIFMKSDDGKPAHAGFPEVSYAKYSSVLVNKGYRVIRVEQTETPAMMEERIQITGHKGKFDRVVKREVCQVTTRGTQMMSIQDSVFHTAQNQYLLAVCESTSDSSINGHRVRSYGICFTDVTTNTLFIGQFDDDNNLSNFNILLAHHSPTEVLYERGNLSQPAYQAIMKTGARLSPLRADKEFWPVKKTLSHLKTHQIFADDNGRCVWPDQLKSLFEDGEDYQEIVSLEPRSQYSLALYSFGAIVFYLHTQLIEKQVLRCISMKLYTSPLSAAEKKNFDQAPPMIMDHVALKNLEVFLNNSGTTKLTLFDSINHCKTHFGQRLLKNWLCSPLCDIEQIQNRLDAVETLMSNASGSLINEISHVLSTTPDLERILSKIKNQCYKSESESRAIMFDGDQHSKAKITSFLNLLSSFKRLHKFIQSVSKLARQTDSHVLKRLLSHTTEGGLYPDYSETLKYFENSFDHGLAQKTGKIIPSPGIDREYDDCEQKIAAIKNKLDDYLEEQKSVLRCKQVEYFGTTKNRYQIQVPEAYLKNVPDGYRLETARKGCKRFYTPTIDKLFSELTCYEERMKKILDGIMSRIFEQFMNKISLWSAAIECIAILDVLQSIASFTRTLKANNIDICRPEFINKTDKPLIEYNNGRHPVLVKNNPNYIPNDLTLDDRLVLLSGANMGGKSTLMRQTALLVVLAQIGCFVPASNLRLTPVDRIFSRLGASDRLLEGESTFYTELVETSAMLRCATKQSLLLLDELGRGTSTFDGTAIAHSVIKEISNNLNCRCLFSTHYHTLSKEFEAANNVRSAHMACKVEKDSDDLEDDPLKENVTFLYKITEGAAARSYGFNVAKLAGISDDIIRDAFKKSSQMGKLVQ